MTQSTETMTPIAEAKPKRYKVVDGPISIRQEPGGLPLKDRLSQGAEFEAVGEPVERDGYRWIQHPRGWSAMGNIDGTENYMLDISDRPADAPRTFRVWAGSISIRDTPNGKRLAQKLFKGKEISVDPLSRTELANYVWWKHDLGWSAECSVNGKEIYMKEVFDSPPKGPIIDPAKRVTLPETWKGKYVLQVAQAAKVRNQPSTDPRGMILITLKRGKLVTCDLDNIVEADGYFWTRHELGWSVIMSIDGKQVFLAEPGTVPGLIYIGPNGPKAEELPGYRSLITRHPLNLNDIQWFQYFGNNMWAYVHGKSYGYDRYSQGLHGGLDYGNSLRSGIVVYAGIEGEYVKTEYPSRNNARVLVKSGDYLFIYQHITSARYYAPGQKITPDMPLCNIEHKSIDNGWDHLHLEVRYMDEWIINPLLLMTEQLYNEIIARFNPTKPNESYGKMDSSLQFFYSSPRWNKWNTPLDQPMIKYCGPGIGPRFEQTDAAYDDQ